MRLALFADIHANRQAFAACLDAAGQEYVNYAIITKSGQSQAPADPLRQTLTTFSTTSFMIL